MDEKNEYNNHSDLNEDDIEKILTIISTDGYYKQACYESFAQFVVKSFWVQKDMLEDSSQGIEHTTNSSVSKI